MGQPAAKDALYDGLARTRREGTRIHYCLASERVALLWAALRDVATEHRVEAG